MDKKICVKFTGGREGMSFPPLFTPQALELVEGLKLMVIFWTVTGTLKGYDALMNLVLDDVDEVVRDDEGNTSARPLGLVVARGTLLVLVSPVDGSEEIANPFVQEEEWWFNRGEEVTKRLRERKWLQRSLLCMMDRWEQNGDCRCNRLQNGRKD
jgi:U6 snRNA-associated Sm-like protein LSm7